MTEPVVASVRHRDAEDGETEQDLLFVGAGASTAYTLVSLLDTLAGHIDAKGKDAARMRLSFQSFGRQAFARRGVRIIQVYGATETGPISVYERFDQARALCAAPMLGSSHAGCRRTPVSW